MKHIWLAISVLVVIAVFTWPINQPTHIVEISSQVTDVTPLSADNTVTQAISSQEPISGISVWYGSLAHYEEPFAESPINLTVSQHNETIAEVSKNFPGTRDNRRLDFFFKKIPAGEYQLTISAPNAPDSKPLQLQGANPEFTIHSDTIFAYQTFSHRNLAASLIQNIFLPNKAGEDISHHFRRGTEILNGANPYTCAREGSCPVNKVPIHLPLFYYFSATSQELGLSSFDTWIIFWQIIFWACWFGIGLLLFTFNYRRGRPLLALAILLSWLLNRWSLYVLSVGHIDFLALIFFIASLITFTKHKKISFTLLGISLAIKHIAIIILPIYLILSWRRQKLKQAATNAALALITPFIFILPLAITDFSGVVHGLTFASTRTLEANFGAPSLDTILGLSGTSSSMFFLGLLVIIYFTTWRRQINLIPATFFAMLTFVTFNTSIFNQYFVWLLAPALLFISNVEKSKN